MTLQQKGQSPSAPSNLASGRGKSVVSAFAKMCPFTQETSAAEQKKRGTNYIDLGRLVLLSIAKLSSGTWLGEAVFEKKVNKQNLQRTTTTKTKRPQSHGTAASIATLSQFSEELPSEAINTGKPIQKKPGTACADPTHPWAGCRAEWGHSSLAGGEMSAEGRSQEQISLGQVRH